VTAIATRGAIFIIKSNDRPPASFAGSFFFQKKAKMKISTFSLFSLNAFAEQATNSAAIDAKIAELSPIVIAGEWKCEKIEKTEKRMLAKCVAVCPDFDGTFNYLRKFVREALLAP